MRHRRLLGALALVAVTTAATWVTGAASAPPAEAATFPLESTYAAPGTWAVTTGSATDGAGNAFTLYYPSNLGANGFDHPIVTWGNGTNATPGQYSGLLNQLASWGFVVIASNSTGTGTGNEITAGANYLVAQNGVAASPF